MRHKKFWIYSSNHRKPLTVFRRERRETLFFFTMFPVAMCRVEETRDHWGLSQPGKYNEMPE